MIMTDKNHDANPDGITEESGEEITEASLIGELAANLAQTESEEPEEETTEEVETEETESTENEVGDEEESEEETEAEEESEETEEDDVLSQYDFTALDGESAEVLGRQFAESLGDNAGAFAKGLGSNLGKDLGKLRSENRAKDEQIAALEKQVSESIQELVPSDNQFSSITDEAKLKETEDNARAIIKAYQPRVQNDEWEYGPDGEEGAYGADNKFYKKSEVVAGVLATQSQLVDIEKQKSNIRELKSVTSSEKSALKEAEKELEWLADEESENYKQFKELSDEFSLLSKVSPKAGAKLKRLLAHAVNSMSGKPAVKRKVTVPKKKAKAVSGNLASSAASARPQKRSSKERESARKRIMSGEGSVEDIIKASFN